MWQDGEHEAREEKLFGDAARHALALCLFFFFAGKPRFWHSWSAWAEGRPGGQGKWGNTWGIERGG